MYYWTRNSNLHQMMCPFHLLRALHRRMCPWHLLRALPQSCQAPRHHSWQAVENNDHQSKPALADPPKACLGMPSQNDLASVLVSAAMHATSGLQSQTTGLFYRGWGANGVAHCKFEPEAFWRTYLSSKDVPANLHLLQKRGRRRRGVIGFLPPTRTNSSAIRWPGFRAAVPWTYMSIGPVNLYAPLLAWTWNANRRGFMVAYTHKVDSNYADAADMTLRWKYERVKHGQMLLVVDGRQVWMLLTNLQFCTCDPFFYLPT